MQGKIIKGIAGFYYIYAENDEIYECKAKGIFRKDKQKPLVGDNVEIEVLDEQGKEGSVTAILPRKNSLIRPLPMWIRLLCFLRWRVRNLILCCLTVF